MELDLLDDSLLWEVDQDLNRFELLWLLGGFLQKRLGGRLVILEQGLCLSIRRCRVKVFYCLFGIVLLEVLSI